MSRGGAERDGNTKSEAGSRLWAVSTMPDMGLELMNLKIMTWAAQLTAPLRHSGAPPILHILFFFFNIYLFSRDRERHSMSRGGGGRERYRIWSRLQALSCQFYPFLIAFYKLVILHLNNLPFLFLAYSFLKVFKFILRDRGEREHTHGQGRGRERQRERIPSRLLDVSA